MRGFEGSAQRLLGDLSYGYTPGYAAIAAG